MAHLHPSIYHLSLYILSIIAISARQITIKNSCSATIYPALQPAQGVTASDGSAQSGGWELAQGGSTTVDVPEGCELSLMSTVQARSVFSHWIHAGIRGGHVSADVGCVLLGC